MVQVKVGYVSLKVLWAEHLGLAFSSLLLLSSCIHDKLSAKGSPDTVNGSPPEAAGA